VTEVKEVTKVAEVKDAKELRECGSENRNKKQATRIKDKGKRTKEEK
jgi:hypothetical protein